ncbi:MAG: efflux RND transporter periplasmic adaptor subunit, partial [Planctomycetota bacterium]|nr:efflux RND transporter periplasmic adaptor subunit [Planctomycetota bacterium]
PTRFPFAYLALALLLLFGAGFTGWAIRGGGVHDHEAETAQAAPNEAAVEVWTCSMHPQIRSPQPGKCPICGMDLIPVPQGDSRTTDPRTLPLSASAAALADVRTLVVERRALDLDLRMVGKIAYDETRLSDLTAWMPGRLDRLFVDSTGVPVREGEHMAEIYSPKLFAAQEELLQAARSVERLAQSPLEDLRRTSVATLEAVRSKLRLLGLTDAQIEGVLERGSPQVRLTLYAPAGGIVIEKLAQEGGWVNEGSVLFRIADIHTLWLELDAYESDLSWLRSGQEVRFSVAAYPGETFIGRISLIHPMLRQPSRTVRVRVVVSNEDLRLKPGMFASAHISVGLGTNAQSSARDLMSEMFTCPMHPEVLQAEPGECPICSMPLEPAGEIATGSFELPLAIPATAPLLTGERAVVYVRVGDDQNPAYEARRVVLGPRAGDWYPVLEGLMEGERVVVQGAFRLDSELQIRGGESMMHTPKPAETAKAPVQIAAPDPFRSAVGDAFLRLDAAATALAADDFEAAREALVKFGVALAGVDASLIQGSHAGHAEMSLRRLAAAAAAAATAEQLEAARAVFPMVILEALALVETFGYAFEDGRSLVLLNCPMAFDGKGGDWIQFAGTETANPYFGETMLRCGDEVRTLPTGGPR